MSDLKACIGMLCAAVGFFQYSESIVVTYLLVAWKCAVALPAYKLAFLMPSLAQLYRRRSALAWVPLNLSCCCCV